MHLRDKIKANEYLRLIASKKISRSRKKDEPEMNPNEITVHSAIFSLQRSLLFVESGFISLQQFPPPPSGEGVIPRKIGKGLPKTFTLSLLPTLFIA